ncbi:diacylglycerol kinase [Agarilytica rhodophyticola]|uniref:diacylglycerol kinase n=1 Tax=Agarilytica rhodophyticola TaxID=1737490 RepID=UPI000B347316|nr:diacylglycerol kinase [Agarilytica rhodophyticola]
MIKKNTGFTRVSKAAYYSYKGVRSALVYEAAFRQEMCFALVLIPATFWLPVSKMERIALVASVILVLIIELLNSSIEAVVDRIGYEKHELAGRAKDMGSAAVLISLLLWGYVWGSILFL